MQEKYEISSYPATFEAFAEKFKNLTAKSLMKVFFMRTQTCKLFIQRTESAREVIDLIARELDMTDMGLYLYSACEGQTPIVEKLRQMQKHIDEFENETRVLRLHAN
jgi:hypothetical protein